MAGGGHLDPGGALPVSPLPPPREAPLPSNPASKDVPASSLFLGEASAGPGPATLSGRLGGTRACGPDTWAPGCTVFARFTHARQVHSFFGKTRFPLPVLPLPQPFLLEKKNHHRLETKKSLFGDIQMHIYYTHVGINNVNDTASSCWLFIH